MLDNVYNMAELMLNADVSIGAGGTTSWERCFMALPTVLLIDAKPIFNCKNLETAGAVFATEKKIIMNIISNKK